MAGPSGGLPQDSIVVMEGDSSVYLSVLEDLPVGKDTEVEDTAEDTPVEDTPVWF